MRYLSRLLQVGIFPYLPRLWHTGVAPRVPAGGTGEVVPGPSGPGRMKKMLFASRVSTAARRLRNCRKKRGALRWCVRAFAGNFDDRRIGDVRSPLQSGGRLSFETSVVL